MAKLLNISFDPNLSHTQIYLNNFVQEVLDVNKVLIEEHQAAISIELKTPFVKGDASKLQQLFQNLLSNAIKYKKIGETPKVSITAFSKKEGTLFRVKDNGIGIEPTYFNKIFLLFKRLHNKKDYPGTGIGLAMCKKIIDMHGGKIWVESTFGEGTTFSFSLPK